MSKVVALFNAGNVWVTDGTAAGTSELSVAGAFINGLVNGLPPLFAVLGSEALFPGFDSTTKLNLWVTDGTSAGTSELSVSGAASSGLNPTDLTVFGNEVLFNGTDSSGKSNLWVTDGTAAGTSELSAPCSAGRCCSTPLMPAATLISG